MATNLENGKDAGRHVKWPSPTQLCRLCGRGPFRNARTRRQHEVEQHLRRVGPGLDLDAASQPGEVGLDADPIREPGQSNVAFRLRVRRRLRRIAYGEAEP